MRQKQKIGISVLFPEQLYSSCELYSLSFSSRVLNYSFIHSKYSYEVLTMINQIQEHPWFDCNRGTAKELLNVIGESHHFQIEDQSKASYRNLSFGLSLRDSFWMCVVCGQKEVRIQCKQKRCREELQRECSSPCAGEFGYSQT